MNGLTVAEQALIVGLLAQYRVDILRAIAAPPEKSQLTEQGRQRYRDDAAIAGSALDKFLAIREQAA